MGDYLSPRKQQVYLRLRERLDKVRKSNEQSQRIFEASNPQRREQERQDTQDFHRRIIENRNKRAPRSVKAQESGQSKVKSESNGNCTNNEMGRNQPQVVKKAVDRKRPNPDSPNLTGTTEAINRTSALSLEASSSSSGMRGDASPAKKPCVDSKQLAPGQVPTPNQYVQQQDPNRMGANNHAAQLTDNGVSNQAAHGASGGDGIEGVQGLDLLNDIGNSESVLRLLDDPSGTHLDEMMKSGQFNPETLLSELSRLESNLSMQLGEMPDIATNSPGSQDASKQSDTKPDTASNNTETGVVPKSENSDTYDPMMEGPPNTVATDALQKSGPLPSIHEFKPSSGKGVLVKQEPQQINASRATFNGQNVQTVTSSGAQNIVPQVNQLTPMQATGTSASAMNPSMRGSFVNQQSGMSGQQVNFLSTQQQQQLSSRQLLLNARMPSQQSHHSRMPNSMLSNTMNASMSSADQLSQFANNSMRGQSPQPGRLPSMQSLFQDCNPPMALSGGQGGNMMPGQASQFVQHSQQQQRIASTEILQRLQKPPHYNASAEQRKFVTNSYVQSPQQGHNMQQGNSQMLIPRRPPPRYDETPHRNSMAFQGPVNQGMPQQLGQQAGMMTHMVGQQNIRSMVPGQGVQGHLSNGMSAGAGNRGMMQGMAQQQSQQGMMQRLTPQIRRQILQQRAMQQQSSAMGNQMNMASIPPGAVNIGQAGVAQYQQRHMPAQWSGNQLLQHRMQQQNNNFQGNNVMQQQPYPTQQRFPQRNVMDSNMRTFQNITSQGGMSNVTNTNPSIMAQQQFVGQPAQSQQQQTQQPTQQQQQQPQPQQQQGSMQQPVQGNSITAMQNGSAVSGTNQSYGNNAQQMPMGMMLDSNNQQQQQQQQQQQPGSSDVLELLDNIIKNDGPGRTNSHM